MILAPWKGGNRSAYHRVTDLTTLPKDAARRRNVFSFIATDEALAAHPVNCAGCGEPVTDDRGERGNRGEFFPRSKTFVIRHYLCAWGRTLGDLETLLTTGRS